MLISKNNSWTLKEKSLAILTNKKSWWVWFQKKSVQFYRVIGHKIVSMTWKSPVSLTRRSVRHKTALRLFKMTVFSFTHGTLVSAPGSSAMCGVGLIKIRPTMPNIKERPDGPFQHRLYTDSHKSLRNRLLDFSPNSRKFFPSIR